VKKIIMALTVVMFAGLFWSNQAEARCWWNGYNHCRYYHNGWHHGYGYYHHGYYRNGYWYR
jgi:hypothetical protein